MTPADSTRRSQSEIVDAIEAQLQALMPLTPEILVTASGDPVHGKYTYDAGTNRYTSTVNPAYEIFFDGNNWVLAESGANAYRTTGTSVLGPWIINAGEDAGGAPAPAVAYNDPVFQRIQRFDVESLTEAFRLLIISEQRICVILILDEQFTPILEERKLVVSRVLPIALLVSDRRLGDRVKALWGDPANANVPGAFALAERTLPAVTGQLLDNEETKSGIISEPTLVNSIFLTDTDQKNLPGRAAVMVELHCSGGTLEARLGLGPTI